jgi:RNA polymerase sigma factor (sigma-70 family)
MARRWTQNPSHLEDLVAEGVIGLIRAAENFDLSRDVRFSTYAAWWVRNELSGAMKRVRGSFAVINEEAARDWPPAEAEETAPADRMRPDAFYDLDSLPGDLPSPEEDAMRRSDEEMLSRQLRAALMELGPDEIEIVRRRRLVPQPEPVKALARDLGKTPERVRQIETRALQRLRQKLLAQGFNLSMLH